MCDTLSGRPPSGPARKRYPDPALELIFLQAGSAARRAELDGRTREALSRVDFSSLAWELAARHLLPLIGGRILTVGGGFCPDSFQEAVRAARATARARGLAVEAATRRVTSLLTRHEIRALPLKGPLLADAAHGDIGLRETHDVDVLVSPERLHHAALLLRAEGFERPTDRIRRDGLPALHLAVRHPVELPVELHWRVHWYETAFSREMLARAEPGPDGLLRAQPDDLAVSMLLFYARDGFHGVRLAADVAAWWDRNGHVLPRRSLEAYARHYTPLSPTLTASAIAADEVTGTALLDQLGSARAPGRRVSLAARLADWTQAGDRDQLAANISLAGGLLAPPGTAREFARRELVPGSGPVAPHAAKMIVRYASALTHLRRGRRWVEAPPERPGRIELLAMPLDTVTEAGVIAHVIGSLDSDHGGWVITANLDHLRQFATCPDLQRLFEEANLVVADGMPLVWATQLAGTPLPGRVAGSDLVWSLTAEAASRGRSLFLLGGAPGACIRATETIRLNYPDVRISGTYSPPFGFEDDPAEMDEIRDRLRAARPDIVYVALGFPKQERLIRELRSECPAAWFLGVGISFSFLAGDVPRAPDWVQRVGLEWAHRLASEPRRLARRYLVQGLPFAGRLAAYSLWARAHGGLRTRPAERAIVPSTRESFPSGASERRRAAGLTPGRAR